MNCKCNVEMRFLTKNEYGADYWWCPECGSIYFKDRHGLEFWELTRQMKQQETKGLFSRIVQDTNIKEEKK